MEKKKSRPRNESQKAHDKEVAAKLRLEGKSLREISAQLDITHVTVRADLKHINKKLLDAAETDLTKLKNQQVAKLRWAQEQAVLGWKKSLKNAEKTVTKEKAVVIDDEIAPIPGIETTKTSEGQSGNPAHLRAYTDAVEKESKVLGLLDKVEGGDPGELDKADEIIAAQLRESRLKNAADKAQTQAESEPTNDESEPDAQTDAE